MASVRGKRVRKGNAQRGGFSSRAGLWLAAGVALLFVATVAVFLVRGRAGGAAPSSASPAAPLMPGAAPVQAGAGLPGLGAGSRFFVQFVDKADPTRLAGEITAERSIPQPMRRYELEQPSAWFFLRDGRSVHVQAASGNIKLPEAGGQPDDGRLEGDVVIRTFAPRGDGKRPDLATDEPSMTVRTPRMSVDMVLGQLDAPDRVTVQSQRIEYAGAGLSAQFDASKQRVEQVFVARSEVLVVRPAARARGTTLAAPPAAPQDQAAPQQPTADATPSPAPTAPLARQDDALLDATAEQSLYHLRAIGPVRIERGTDSLQAGEVDAFARLIDNQLPARTRAVLEGAQAGQGSEPAPATTQARADEPAPAPASAGEPSSLNSNAAPEGVAPETTASLDATPIIARWDGPLQVQRVADGVPALLADEDLVVRALRGDANASVVVDAKSIGATAQAGTLAYGATRQRFSMIASGAEAGDANAVATRPGAGSAQGPRIDVDLASGRVRLPSGGTLRLFATDEAAPPGAGGWAGTGRGDEGEVTWTGAGEFLFARDASGTMTTRLTNARLTQDVRGWLGKDGASDGGRFRADEATLATRPRNSGDRGQDLRLAEVALVGAAQVETRSNTNGVSTSMLSGDALRVAFDPGQAGNVARTVTARGKVRARDQGSTLEADELVATLQSEAPNTAGATSALGEVAEAIATGSVRFASATGERATARALRARPADRTVQLEGTPLEPARVETTQGSLAAGFIDLDDAQRRAIVRGPGTLEARTAPPSVADAAPASGGQRVTIAWQGSAEFDQRAGTAVARGATRTDARSADGLDHNTIEAEMLEVGFVSGAAPGAPAGAATMGDARVTSVRATGTRADAPPPTTPTTTTTTTPTAPPTAAGEATPATPNNAGVRLYARRFASPTPAGSEAALERVLFLDASNAEVDVPASIVRVAGAGKLLLSDRTKPAGTNAGAAGAAPGSIAAGMGAGLGGPGDALLAWRDGLTITTRAGLATALGAASLTRRSGSELVRVTSDRMEARFDAFELEAASRAALRSVAALGGAWATAQGRELTAAGLWYDVASEVIEARGEGLTPATVVSTADAGGTPMAPISGRVLRWDVPRGRVDVVEAGVVGSPR